MRVLITGARAPVALEWARALARCGHPVAIADSMRFPLAAGSRYVHRHYRLPLPVLDTQRWGATLAAAADDFDADLLLPTCEEIFFLDHQRDRFSGQCRLLMPSSHWLHRLHDKAQFAKFSSELPLTTPETRLLEAPRDLDAYARDHARWVFKPVYSRFAAETVIRPGRRRFRRLQSSMLGCPGRAWIAQRSVSGRELCSFSLLEDGHLCLHACYHPRHRVGQGSGIYFEGVEDPDVLAFVRAFGAATGYTGQVGFDFIREPNGRPYVLECNPRATSGLHLFGDRPDVLAAALQGRLKDTEIGRGDYVIRLAMMLFRLPRAGLRPAFWRDLARAKDVIARDSDIGPLLQQFPLLLELSLRALRFRRGLLSASTFDIEWNGGDRCTGVARATET